MSALTQAPPQQETLTKAAEQWFIYRGVPHFQARRENLELRPANVITSLILAISFGAVAADAEGLSTGLEIGICTGIVLLLIGLDLLRRRLRKEKDRFRWPAPGRSNLYVVIAIVLTAAIDAGLEWHDELRVLLLVLAWSAIALLVGAVTPNGAWRIFRWAVGHLFREASHNARVLAGAVPLLLLTIGFLFMTAELWHVATHLTTPELAGAVGLFVALGGCFLFVLARQHITKAQQFADWDDVRACLGDSAPDPLAPLEALEAAVNDCLDRAPGFMKWEEARVWLVQRKDEAAASRPPVPIAGTNEAAQRLRRLCDETDWDNLGKLEPVKLGWRERWNITIVMVFAQSIQVLAVTLVMALFLLAFGLLTVDDETLQGWGVIANNAEPPKSVLPPWSDLHLKVIALLAAFAGLTFAVYAALFRDQREIFFGENDRKATQRLAVRALYRCQLKL